MRRRDFIKNSMLGVASTSAALAVGGLPAEGESKTKKSKNAAKPAVSPDHVYSAEKNRIFPTNAPERQWARFRADGYSQPACGVVYRKEDTVPHGMPLGGVATGCMDVDTDGTFGFFNLFNSGVPTRGPIEHGFLGIASGERCWVLTTKNMIGTENAKNIHYWGHYPIVDMEYDIDGPFSVGLRAWCPFIPGDTQTSNTPAAVFEVHVRNNSDKAEKVTVGLSFPGPTQAEAQISPTSERETKFVDWEVSYAINSGVVPAKRERITEGDFHGLLVSSPLGTEYAIGTIGDTPLRFGNAFWVYGYEYTTGQHWVRMTRDTPRFSEGEFSTGMAADIEVGANEEKIVRLVVAWYSPIWKGEKTNYFSRMYTKRYKGAADVAKYIADNHESLLRRIISWQQAVYTADEYPLWLRESLVNIFHLTPKTGYWAVANKPIGDWCKEEDGLFGMSECPRECPQIECIPCSFYGNVPLVYFFPELALSTLRGYKAYQYPDGAPPWVFGGCTAGAAEGYNATDPCDMATPSPGYQNTLNGPCYVDMFDRYWQRTGDDEILREFYPSIKKAVEYTISLRPGADGIVSVPTGNRNPTQPHAKPGGGLDWFEGNGWFGMTPHVGGIHLAMLAMAERMAKHMNDATFASQCRDWINQGSHSMETKLWAGDYYLAYYEPESNLKSDLVFGYQLDGDWMAKYHGLPGVFKSDRADTTLKKIKQTCIAINRYGAANFARPTATTADPKDFAASNWGLGYGAHGYFPPEVYMLGATYIYAGDVETGREIVRTCLEGISVAEGYTWTQPNVVSGDTGRVIYGSDYYQNMMLWAVPAALDGHDIEKATGKGSLVERVLKAGKTV
jgi:non-lysosomal glucosylceramidase